jgi:RNA polymerase sigma-70 factor (ECF subfamily)
LGPEQRMQLGCLDRALTRLPAELRMPWMLRYVEACELTEVAEQCGASLATIKRRIRRADARLLSALGGDASPRRPV